MKKQQTGGTVIGFIVGVVVGLAAALAVAVYVTKVPVPFLNKNPRSSEVNLDGKDLNAPLYGKTPARPPAVAPVAPAEAPPVQAAAA
ncbi:MAG: sporulation protein, partial [Acidovorax sp.]